MIRLNYRLLLLNAERLSIALGFGLTLLGLLGAQFYLGPAQVRLDSAADALATTRAQARILATAQALDNAFGQLGSLVFVLNAHEAGSESQAAAIGSLQRRAIERRHEGVRNYLAQLGLAGAIDFRGMSAAYDELVEAERRDFSLATFQAANAFERDLAMAMVRKSGQAFFDAIRLHSDWVHAEDDVRKRRLVLLGISVAGFFLLFIATWRAHRGQESVATAARPGDAEAAPDMDRVGRLLTLAREDIRRRRAVAADAGRTPAKT